MSVQLHPELFTGAAPAPQVSQCGQWANLGAREVREESERGGAVTDATRLDLREDTPTQLAFQMWPGGCQNKQKPKKTRERERETDIYIYNRYI